MSRPDGADLGSVLLVEDDEVTIDLLTHFLTREGFPVSVASDGRQAVAWIASNPPPDFVLLDLMLPYHSGFEIIREVREHPRWREVPIVVLSSKSQEKDVVRALEAGADDYVTKPFKPRELLARLRRCARAPGEPDRRAAGGDPGTQPRRSP